MYNTNPKILLRFYIQTNTLVILFIEVFAEYQNFLCNAKNVIKIQTLTHILKHFN